ncbi:MAG: hypothetical protein IH947_06210 [Bacteroidetes bacterium]|nr:hypothetical protein [Bacteroidota bacterium]
MRFPSLFKTPAHKRFDLQPRYYDPIKEEIENRTWRIKREMKEKSDSAENAEEYNSRIVGSFHRKSNFTENKTGMIRFTIMVMLIFSSIGYLYWGNVVLYILAGFGLSIYILLKFRKK